MHHHDAITITGAREHNLRDLTLALPRHRLVAITGVSGSGKSTLAFDTLAAEANRQLAETLPWFVRDRMPRHPRPDADLIDGLTPAVVVDHRPPRGGARSVVGTAADILPVLRVLYSRCAHPDPAHAAERPDARETEHEAGHKAGHGGERGGADGSEPAAGRGGEPAAGPASAFSFNEPDGMCPACHGLGAVTRLDLDAFLDRDRSLDDGAIRFAPFGTGTWVWQTHARSGLFDPTVPLRDYTPEQWHTLLHGKGFKVSRDGGVGGDRGNTYEGLADRFERMYLRRDTADQPASHRRAVAAVTTRGTCPDCGGDRLNAAARTARIAGRTLPELTRMETTELIGVLTGIAEQQGPVAAAIAEHALTRLHRLADAGLGYLTLGRPTRTLSGGEARRLKAVRYLGSTLTGLTYLFDEPSTGLHPADVDRLTGLLRRLVDRGNTVIAVDHDPAVIAAADHAVELGPGAGEDGGRLLFSGDLPALRAAATPTARALTRPAVLNTAPRRPTGWLTVDTTADLTGPDGPVPHNLHPATVRFPTGVLTCVTGVAGAGKTTLAARLLPAAHPAATVVDQSPINASRRASPATHLGLLDPIRRLFAAAHDTDPGLFSHNSTGACPGCDGAGTVTTDLAFLDPVTTACRTCHGTRYRPETARYPLRGHTIAQVMAMTAAQAAEIFPEPAVQARLTALDRVGLGHLTLGRPLTTLSGGERQRLKLAAHLHRTGHAKNGHANTGHANTGRGGTGAAAGLYVLDEPTAGLHRDDVTALLALLDRLVDDGATVITVEHDLDVIAHADHIIELGPGGGTRGGRLTFTGPPAALRDDPDSPTAPHLRNATRPAGRPAA
ncbi:ATP-binding cassette domain-containing protein [Actinomadura rupiterrae]|uniref:ATP-binding cassette domain-containing protein n=1 Tax=Actinomadura rupiterrae TaxID=559627 RepID=UPI0026467A0E|nr:ATP-binding cassette domain-containing protein [Actinomadura rupiterrae]MCP2343266.1 excinuclease UvrABC ATPase subunit [Actinomadura rupiterrae]